MGTLRVKCPACSEIIEVDSRTGKVEKHHPEVKARAGTDFLSERLKSLDEEKARREAIVAESRERERTLKDSHDKLFAKVKKQAKEGPVDRPLRDIDID